MGRTCYEYPCPICDSKYELNETAVKALPDGKQDSSTKLAEKASMQASLRPKPCLLCEDKHSTAYACVCYGNSSHQGQEGRTANNYTARVNKVTAVVMEASPDKKEDSCMQTGGGYTGGSGSSSM